MAIQKKELPKHLRMVLLIAFILVFVGLVYSLITSYSEAYKQPTTINKSETMYRYNHQGKINYLVKLKPNEMFKENFPGSGNTYYSKLTDYIKLDYSYLFSADQETQLEGNYTITATLEAKDMWKKDFILVPSTPFSGEGKNFDFNKSYQLKLEPFREYLKKVNEEIGVSARDPKVTVKVAIMLDAGTKAGSFRESLVPTMVIPLSEGEYKIDGNLIDKKSNSISKSVKVMDPTLKEKKSRFTLMCISTILVVIFLGYLLFYTKGKPLPPKGEDVLIRKKYGERLFEVPGGIELGGNVMVVSFNSFDDLVKIADELGKPIIYFNSAGLVNYFLFDGQVVYKYLIPRGKTQIIKQPNISTDRKVFGG